LGTALHRLFNNNGNNPAPVPPLESRPKPQAAPRRQPELPRIAAAPAPVKEPPFVMEIIQGKDRKETKFTTTPEVK